jgi:outer membrane biosynthesis protein TonB
MSETKKVLHSIGRTLLRRDSSDDKDKKEKEKEKQEKREEKERQKAEKERIREEKRKKLEEKKQKKLKDKEGKNTATGQTEYPNESRSPNLSKGSSPTSSRTTTAEPPSLNSTTSSTSSASTAASASTTTPSKTSSEIANSKPIGSVISRKKPRLVKQMTYTEAKMDADTVELQFKQLLVFRLKKFLLF